MSRMLAALKALENRHPAAVAPPSDAEPFCLDPIAAASPESVEPPLKPLTVHVEPEPVSPSMFEMCSLPTPSDVADHYFKLSARIGQQLASNYCNVLLFVGADDRAGSSFSMTELAQAFALESDGNVLLVDGDLSCGRLSKSVCPSGAGLIEAMLGTAHWPEIIHPTTTARVDFVASGHGQVPTFERPEFGWSALRPKYRTVLIGIGAAGEPETHWLSARCDGVYFLISRPRTKRRAASAAINALRACGANVLGCVLTNG
jgi:Mrp family chromosome partitioning ATPase